MTISFEEIKARLLANPEVQREYESLAPEFEALKREFAARQAEAGESPVSRRIIKTDPNLTPKR